MKLFNKMKLSNVSTNLIIKKTMHTFSRAFIITGFILLIANCASWLPWQSKSTYKNDTDEFITPASSQDPALDVDKGEVETLFNQFQQRQFQEVMDNSKKFLELHPYSARLNEVLYLQGLCFEHFEDWHHALENYHRITENSLVGNKQYLSLALYRQSICYEALEEKEKAIASLNDALRWQGFLPLEVSEAQIPARMASIYASLRQTVTADYYSSVAEKGIRKLKSLKKYKEQNWLGETLYQMGSLPMDHLTTENYFEHLLSFSRHQKYLLQTIELADPKWSPLAYELLFKNYNDFWSQIKNEKGIQSNDWEIDLVSTAVKRGQMASQLLEAIEVLKSYEAPKETLNAERTAAIFDKLKPLEDSVNSYLQDEILKKPWQKNIYSSDLKDQNSSIRPLGISGKLTSDSAKSSEDTPPAGISTKLPTRTKTAKLTNDNSEPNSLNQINNADVASENQTNEVAEKEKEINLEKSKEPIKEKVKSKSKKYSRHSKKSQQSSIQTNESGNKK